MLSILLTIVLAAWFGYLAVVGTELSGSMYDRVMHAMGVIVSSINFPVLQILAALLLLVAWPRNWEFSGFSDHEPTDIAVEIDAGSPAV